MTFTSPGGLERRYGGPNGYGHAGYSHNVLSLPRDTARTWGDATSPRGFWAYAAPRVSRTPIAHLFASLGLKFGALSGVDYRSLVLDPKGPGIPDQTSTSACTGMAEAGSTMTRAVVAGTPVARKLSFLDAYRNGRRIDTIQPDGTFAPLVDDGAIPEQVTRGCSILGICPYDLLPNDPARVNDEPSFEEREQGLRYVVRGIYGLQRVDVEQGVQNALSAGFPVKLGSLVDTAMEEWSGGDPLGPADPSRILGGHAMYVCGFAPWSGGIEYILANSWGTGYGEGGFLRVNGLWLRQASDIEVVDATVLEAA